MKVAVRVTGIIVCVLLLASFLLEPVAGQKALALQNNAPPAPENLDQILISNKGVQSPQGARANHEWTAAEMAAAVPYPVKELQSSRDTLAPIASSPEQMTSSAVQTFSPALPEGEVTVLDELSALGSFAGSAPTGYSYPAPYTRYTYDKKYSTEYPYKTIGKLYFVQNGYSYVCSGAVIGPRAVWTAGHCVHDGSGSSSGWSYYTMFLPAYFNGKKAGGSWYDVELWTTTAWYNGDLSYDYGGIIEGVSKKKKIGQKLGWLGFAYTPNANGYNAQHHWFSIGYPEAPFDGRKQVICASSYAYSDTSLSPASVGIGCDQTGGTSGGPWIFGFGSGYYVNGNMSYRYSGYTHEMFSPYYGDSAYGLWYQLFYWTP